MSWMDASVCWSGFHGVKYVRQIVVCCLAVGYADLDFMMG